MERYNPDFIEKGILEFWKKNKIHQKSKSKNKKGKKFYFLDGPPYTSGKVHIGTSWNKALKDSILRYKRMNGFNVGDRAGYDMHGLPTENATEKELKLKNKGEIEKFGVKNFVKECEKLSLRNLKIMNEDFKRLGVWMDFENAYQSIKKEFIEGEWWLVKRAHEKKRLYEGEKTMHWCARCATALAKHELEYERVRDHGIYVKFPVEGKKDEFLIIFTTAPWTILFNLGIMVNPDFFYARVKTGKETWIIAKDLMESLKKKTGKNLDILTTLKGKELKGMRYRHPFEKYYTYSEFKGNKKVHTVILSKEYVDLETGTGLVHMAPGCGQEDYEVGHREKIPPFNNLDEYGMFPKEINKFSGWKAKIDDKKFIEILEEDGFLIHSETIDHEYPHCWRCKNPVIFRTTTQWFFSVEDLRQDMKRLNKEINWVPDWAGSRQFDSWLDNLRDNGITRQRYWGTPIPVWRCKECKDYVVIGSIKELKGLGGKVPENLHIPFIDKVKLKCKCGGLKERIPDILDVWVDAGTTSWACLDFPQREDLFKEFYPADFILEGKDQIRGWFNLLLINSMLAFGNASFKNVYMHGFVQDAEGRKMSKSLGNYILPEEVISKYGADVLRYYMIGGAAPGVDINYNFEDMKVKYRNLDILWNLHNYLIMQSNFLKKNPSKIKSPKLGLEEQYMLSFLNSRIEEVTTLFENYQLNETAVKIEEIFLELSRNYVQMIRDKLNSGSESEKSAVLYVLYESLIKTLSMLTTITPFISEKIYQNLKKEFNLKEESISLLSWPKADKKLINKQLESGMQETSEIVQEILAQRDKEQIGMKWPLSKVEITSTNQSRLKRFSEIIIVQTNVKVVTFKEGKKKIKLDTKITPELEKEGFTREVVRRIQMLRKKAGLNKEDKIELEINSPLELDEDAIKATVGASKITKINSPKYSDKFKVREKEFEIKIKF